MSEQINKMRMIVKSVDSVLEDDNEGTISKYIEPVASCICCNTPGLSIKINEAHLSGFSHREIIKMFSEDCRKKTGRTLDLRMLTEHFEEHFNSTGVAIAEYNKRKGMANLQPQEKKQLGNIFEALVHDRINDLEVLDLALKEQIKRLQQLQEIKEQRITEGRIDNIESLIMKEEIIIQNLQTNVLNKLKVWQKAKFQSKQLEILDKHSQFLNTKTANFLGIEQTDLMTDPKFAKMAESQYLKVVLENIIKRVDSSLEIVIKLDQYQKSEIYRELNRQCKGIEKEINDQFQEVLKSMKEVDATANEVDEEDIIEEKIEEGE